MVKIGTKCGKDKSDNDSEYLYIVRFFVSCSKLTIRSQNPIIYN